MDSSTNRILLFLKRLLLLFFIVLIVFDLVEPIVSGEEIKDDDWRTMNWDYENDSRGWGLRATLTTQNESLALCPIGSGSDWVTYSLYGEWITPPELTNTPPYHCHTTRSHACIYHPSDHTWAEFVTSRCRIVRYSTNELGKLLNGRTLMLVGDSITGHLLFQLLCDYNRDGHQIHWGKKISTDITPTDNWQVNRIEGSNKQFSFNVVATSLYENSGPWYMRDIVERMTNDSTQPYYMRKTDIMMINIGLHDTDLENWTRQNLEEMRRHKNNNNKGESGELPILLWRETTCTHFHTPSGYFPSDPKQQKRLTARSTSLSPCRPIADTTHETYNYHNKITDKVLQEFPDLNITIVPIFHALSSRWMDYQQFHKTKHPGQKYVDCVHHCTPSASTRHLMRMLQHVLVSLGL